MGKHVNVKEWVAMFKELGLDEAKMRSWHRIFESRHPDGHQSFLEWLGMSDEDIKDVRSDSR